jgi:hypothetical protein
VSVLLREAGGFEGFRVVPEELKSGDLALANRVDTRRLHVRFRPVAPAPPCEPHDYSAGGVDVVSDRYCRVGVPGFAVSLNLSQDRLPTDERPRLGPISWGTPNHVGGEEISPGIHVACVERLEGASHDLNVLLRHRPPSIPHAQESA